MEGSHSRSRSRSPISGVADDRAPANPLREPRAANAPVVRSSLRRHNSAPTMADEGLQNRGPATPDEMVQITRLLMYCRSRSVGRAGRMALQVALSNAPWRMLKDLCTWRMPCSPVELATKCLPNGWQHSVCYKTDSLGTSRFQGA